jgi:starch-binding outer membrane protein, SusD/RagB family
MKNKVILIITILALASVRCTNLDEEMYDKVESSRYGKTPAEIETIVGGAYSSLRGFRDEYSISYPTCEYVFFLVECTSDEACIPTRGTDWFDGGRYQEAHFHTWTPENPMVLSAWRYLYTGVSKVNAVIYQVEQAELSDEEKNNINAELRGLRAYYYYNLLDLFGNVPIITSYEDLELPANSTKAEVYDFVESELLDIMDYLPDEIIYGRFTKNVASTLLARLYLNAEVFIGEAHWQDCIDACDRVTGYQLENDYFTNFLTANEISKENIFVIPYDHKAGTLGNYLASCTFHYKQPYVFSLDGSWGNPCNNGICGQPGLYSSFDESDVRRNSMMIGEQKMLSDGSTILMDNGNPLDYTEAIVNFTAAAQNEGVRLMKYEVKPDEVWERDHDWVLMRYSEVLLMKAECLIRLGSFALARPLIAAVRERAGLDTPENVDLDMLDTELLHEFVFEGHRRTDNIRMGTFFEPWWEKGTTPAYRSIYPIPQDEMAKNDKLVQNPGY